MEILVICADKAKITISEYQDKNESECIREYFLLGKYEDSSGFKVSFDPERRVTLIGNDGKMEDFTEEFVDWYSENKQQINAKDTDKYFNNIKQEFANGIQLKVKECEEYAKYLKWIWEMG